MLNSMKKLQMLYAKSPEIHLAPSPAEQAVHGILFTLNLRTFGYRLLLPSLTNTTECSILSHHAHVTLTWAPLTRADVFL